MVLSAFVFPGAGQIHQRRWVPAAAFGTAFLVCFIVFAVCTARIIVMYYSIAFNFSGFKETPLPLKKAAVSFLLAMLVYAVSLVDTQRAYKRERRRQARQRLEGPEDGA